MIAHKNNWIFYNNNKKYNVNSNLLQKIKKVNLNLIFLVFI